MGRHNLLVLNLIFLTHCAVDLPIEYYISSSCLQSDLPDSIVLGENGGQMIAQAIVDGADAWNQATCLEFFRYKGIYYDDWFTIQEDLQDGRLVVYCVWDSENPDVDKILSCPPEKENCTGDAAYSVADIFIARRGALDATKVRWWDIYHHSTNELPPRKYYLKVFKALAAHELGHRLTLSHNADDLGHSIMNSFLDSWYSAYTPTMLDIWGDYRVDGVCDIYDCPPAEECPTRPVF